MSQLSKEVLKWPLSFVERTCKNKLFILFWCKIIGLFLNRNLAQFKENIKFKLINEINAINEHRKVYVLQNCIRIGLSPEDFIPMTTMNDLDSLSYIMYGITVCKKNWKRRPQY